MRKYRLEVGLKIVGGADDVQRFLDALMADLGTRDSLLGAACGVDLTHLTAKSRPHGIAELVIVLRSPSQLSAWIRGYNTLIDAIVKAGGTPKGWEDAASMFDPQTIQEIKETRREDRPRTVATLEDFAVRAA